MVLLALGVLIRLKFTLSKSFTAIALIAITLNNPD